MMNIIKIITVLWLASLVVACGGADSGGAIGQADSGVSGSTARMIEANGNIYLLSGLNSTEERTLKSYQINDQGSMSERSAISVGETPETLFADERFLYVGSPEAVRVYEDHPTLGLVFINNAAHFLGVNKQSLWFVDPVYSDGEYVYSTLAQGNIEDYAPENSERTGTLFVYQWGEMSETLRLTDMIDGLGYVKGLTIADNKLYVCDLLRGLTVFSLEDRAAPVEIEVIRETKCKDVLKLSDTHIITVSSDSITQYVTTDITDDHESSVMLVSKLTVGNASASVSALDVLIAQESTIIADSRTCMERYQANQSNLIQPIHYTFSNAGTVLASQGEAQYSGTYTVQKNILTIDIAARPILSTQLTTSNDFRSLVDNEGRLYFKKEDALSCNVSLYDYLSSVPKWLLTKYVDKIDHSEFVPARDQSIALHFNSKENTFDGRILCQTIHGEFTVEGGALMLDSIDISAESCEDTIDLSFILNEDTYVFQTIENGFTLFNDNIQLVFTPTDIEE